MQCCALRCDAVKRSCSCNMMHFNLLHCVDVVVQISILRLAMQNIHRYSHWYVM